MDKVEFVEKILNQRYKEDEVVYCRAKHIKYAKCSMNFRNNLGKYYWHNDKERKTKPKRIIVLGVY